MTPLKDLHCKPTSPGTRPLSSSALSPFLAQIPQWKADKTATAIARELELEDFPAAIGFMNRVAAIAEAENHHPDMDIRWNKIKLTLTSHDVGGLSENDLIMAARIDALG